MVSRIVIVDYGSQYAFLIARRLRSNLGGGVLTEIISPSDLSRINGANTSGVVFSGGPNTAIELSDQELRVIHDSSIPVLGICYGHQLLGLAFEGKIAKSHSAEYGPTNLSVTDSGDPLFHRTDQHFSFPVWMSHGDTVEFTDALANSGTVVTSVSNGKNRAITSMSNLRYNCFGVQFHPEVSHTPQGTQILKNFVTQICRLKIGTWSEGAKLERCYEHIRATVGESDRVVLGLSGGIDSAVVAGLLAKSLKPFQWLAVFVDHGMMRAGETDAIKAYAEEQKMPFLCIDKSEDFFRALSGVTDPEHKRSVIGKLFIDAFKEAAETFQPTILAQGTIYPDVVESARASNAGSSSQHLIKSHHNVGGLPEDLGLKLLEPLKWFFKDEVRQIGTDLHLPKSIIQRPPFPGPGIAIRVLGAITREKVAIVQRADLIFHEVLSEIESRPSQFYAALLSGKAVGVVGDQRREGHIICLRAVETDDFMTANVFPFDVKWLQSVATRIVNECSSVARVVFDITPKPPGTIELE